MTADNFDALFDALSSMLASGAERVDRILREVVIDPSDWVCRRYPWEAGVVEYVHVPTGFGFRHSIGLEQGDHGPQFVSRIERITPDNKISKSGS